MSSAAETKAENLRKAMEAMVGRLDKSHLRPMQKEAYLCMAKCTDTAAGPRELQQCCQSCESKMQAAEHGVQHMMNDFQSRLQRCVQRCQDQAQDSLPAQPSDKDVAKAQTKLANCAADCASEYEKQIPKLHDTIIGQLKNLK